MDDLVSRGLAKWPNVPNLYGYLSLSDKGIWHLHPQGNALSEPDTVGQPLNKDSITRFIHRHYEADEQGQWYFQNGPQRAYVRLDAAPYIIRLADNSDQLQTHNDLLITQVQGWYFSHAGQLYLQTEYGPGLLAGRDLPALLPLLQTRSGQHLEQYLQDLDSLPSDATPVRLQGTHSWAPLWFCADNVSMADKLGYIAHPKAPSPN